jgi:SHAQKYF class myb-like DNA-binding protein
MFVVTKGEEKKNRFVTHYETPHVADIKINTFKQIKIQPQPKVKEKEQVKVIEKKNIINPPQIQKNLFCILHNQNQSPITTPKIPSPHLKKKRFIDDDTGNTIGRWTRDEHKKFIEAIIKFGNNWKEVQEYVNTRTSTQARSHAQKFFEKIKKNNTLKFFDSLSSDYSENFTNTTILQLHKIYGNKSKNEINSIVNKFLLLEYDLPKKRRKMVANSIGGVPRKKNNNLNNKKLNDIIEENVEESYEEQNEGDAKENKNNYDENDRNNNYYNNENMKNANNGISMDNNNLYDYNNLLKLYNDQIKQKINEDMYRDCNNYFQYPQINRNYYNSDGIDYIISQFVNNLSNNYYDLNAGDQKAKLNINKRKNTLESFDESSVLNHDNLNYFNQANNNIIGENFQQYNQKSRKNSLESINKLIQNEGNDMNDNKKQFGLEGLSQYKIPMDDFRSQNLLDEDIAFGLLNNINNFRK